MWIAEQCRFLQKKYQSKKTRKAVEIKVGSEGQELKGVEGVDSCLPRICHPKGRNEQMEGCSFGWPTLM